MSVDAELDRWRQEWQSDAPVLPDLSAKVRRQTRFMRLMVAMEMLVTVVIGGGSTVLAALAGQTEFLVLAVAVWIFIAAAWTFAFLNRRGCWVPEALNTAAFLDLSLRRCHADLSRNRFGVVLYFVEILFCLTWIYRHNARESAITPGEFLESATCIVVAVVTVAFVIFSIAYRRRKQTELAYLLKLK
jgi:Na+/proline symporter